MQKTLIVISGPTACGKTALSLDLSQVLDADILNADSRQFYRGMDIGTAKASSEEQSRCPHHFIDFLDVWEDCSAGQYENLVLDFLNTYFQKKDVALLVGGSTFYIKAVLDGLDTFPEVNPELRPQLQAQLEAEGLQVLQNQLKSLDPEYYAQVDLQNPHRLIRALEVCLSSGQPFSSFRQGKTVQRPWRSLYFAPEWPRETLYQRINLRAEQMLGAGLEDEVRALWPHRQCNAMQTVGYREWAEYFEGQQSLEQTLQLIQQHSRNYAKRQLTFLRKEPRLQWLKPETGLAQILTQL